MQEKVKESTKKVRCERGGVRVKNPARLLRVCATELFWACGAGLLGQAEMLCGTRPLGLALLCSARRHTLAVLAGLIVSALYLREASVVYICTYVVAALVRMASALLLDTPDAHMELPVGLQKRLRVFANKKRKDADETTDADETPQNETDESTAGAETGERVAVRSLRESFKSLFTESVCLRMATGAVCSLVVSLYLLISGGFQYYDLFGAFFAVAVTPAAVMVYSVCTGDGSEHRFLQTVSRSALLFSLVWAADGLYLCGLPLSVMMALFFAFYTTATEGLGIGILAAILGGVAIDPLYAPAYLLAVLAFSLFCSMEKENLGLLFGCGAMLAWSVYVGGAQTLWQLLPSALVSATAYTLVMRMRKSPEKTEEEPSDGEEIRRRFEGSRYQDSNERFRGISDAFSSLSEMFYNLSDRFRRPGTLDLRRICDGAFDAFCESCPNNSVCWGLEYSSTLATMNSLISALHTKGKVSRVQIPDALSHRCESADAILEKINLECSKLTGEMLRNNRTEIFAMDYESAASIINDALEEDDGEYRFDHALEQKITEYLCDAGVRSRSVTVYGTRRRQILVRGVNLEQACVTVETLRSDLGELCGMELSRPVFEVEGNVTTMMLQAKRKIAVAGAQNNVSADGGVSGDTVNLFSNKKDYFYALISDGMGAGKEAALTSNICSVFLEKMLRAGNRAGTSLRMLNNMLRSRGNDSSRECSTTVDLAEIDLITGEASFIKSGAAPGFVVRDRVVHRLQSVSIPIGIISTLDVRATPFCLKAGDTVVMISDGILQNDPDCKTLTAFLSTAGSLTPEEIVYHICLQAAQNDNHDDCSAIALRIATAEE